MDEFLLAVVDAAERGLDCPPLRVLTGGLAIWGVPRSSREFLEVSLEPLMEQYEGWSRSRSRRERREEPADPVLLAKTDLENVRWPDDAGQALTLFEVYVWPVAGGDALELPGLRVPVDNIEAWWIAGGKAIEKKQGTSTWFVGGFFPLPLGN